MFIKPLSNSLFGAEGNLLSATAHNHTHEYTYNSQISNVTVTHTKIWVKNWISKDINILSFHYFPHRKNPPLAQVITDGIITD